MKQKQGNKSIFSKKMYEKIKIDLVKSPVSDILTVSGNFDKNQGEWDQQKNNFKNDLMF